MDSVGLQAVNEGVTRLGLGAVLLSWLLLRGKVRRPEMGDSTSRDSLPLDNRRVPTGRFAPRSYVFGVLAR